jgi:archaeosine synthase
MDFRVTNRDGPARIGQLTINKNVVTTPTILFLHTSRLPAPPQAEILLTTPEGKTKKPAVRTNPSLFSTGRKTGKNASLFYPKDVPAELHETTLTYNKNKEYVLIPANRELIPNVIKNNDADLAIVTNAAQLFSQQSLFVDFITTLREHLGYQKLLYLPCIGDPNSIALLTYMGIDLFDSFPALMAARNQTLLFSTGTYKKTDLHELPCTCPICTTINDASTMSFTQILNHNYTALTTEIKKVRNAIRLGALRELVETRIRTSPHLSSLLKILDRTKYHYLEERTPITRKQPLIATTKDALTRPEIRRFQERVIQRYRKPPSTTILLLLPCSAKKPYSFSKTHTLYRERLLGTPNNAIVHEVIITSPLGIVPRELELTYPASTYDIAVTGHWDEDEKKMIRTLLHHYLQNNSYDTIIIHLPAALQEFLIDLCKNPLITCKESPTSPESLDALSDALKKTTQTYPRQEPGTRAAENITSLACYQFGKSPAEQLMKGCVIRGKYPYQKIIQNNIQLGMVTEERGLISLTIEGARRLANTDQYWVDIYGDFTLKGSVFTPGIKDADASIRIGDEVIIRKNTTLCGVGVALMNGTEMTQLQHGEAVKLRHHT